MADRRLKVFISSSPGELGEEREAARAAVGTLRLTPVMQELAAGPGLRERTGIRIWPALRMAFQPAIDAADAAGPEAQSARYEGSYTNPYEALSRLVRARQTASVAG